MEPDAEGSCEDAKSPLIPLKGRKGHDPARCRDVGGGTVTPRFLI